ncbi:MAG TPA: PfkB family carbohydrate kinase [Candidatus Saccharimonadales bacterium]|nr:PfkB family carbohydrate kinase [Candidatus Saccharimonadales bacterium]
MKTSKIVIVGHVCIDQNTTEHASYTGWGSSVLYIEDVFRRMYGLQAGVLTQYGPDLLPYTPGVRFIAQQPTQAQSLRYENDTSVQPRIWRCYNIEYAGEPELTAAAISELEQADIVIVATLLPNYSPAYIAKLMHHVRPQALKVLCPQGYLRAITPEGLVVPRDFVEASIILPAFDLAIYSEEDSPAALTLAAEWSKELKGKIIVTQGEKGASVFTRSQAAHIPTTPIPPEQIIDSVGCGDVFDAAAAYHYYTSHNIGQAVRAAHQAAAKKLRATQVA